MNKEQAFQEGMSEAYRLMDSTISGAIKRNGGATTALQIINVFNEFTSHLHYQRMMLNDALRQWGETKEEPEKEVFAKEREEVEALLRDVFGIQIVKGGIHS